MVARPPYLEKDMKSLNTITFHDGQSKKEISKAHLVDIRSRVTTHEGELLIGSKGRNYMDKYSRKYLGKNLKESYRDLGIK